MTQMIYRPRQYEFARSLNEAIIYTAQKMKFSIKDFLSKFDQIRSFLRIGSYLLKTSVMENFIFCAVLHQLFVHGLRKVNRYSGYLGSRYLTYFQPPGSWFLPAKCLKNTCGRVAF